MTTPRWTTFDDIHEIGAPTVEIPAEPTLETTKRLVRALMLDVYAAVRYQAIRSVPHYAGQTARNHEATAAACRVTDRGAERWLVLSVAAGIVRKVAARVGNADVRDRRQDLDAADRILGQARMSVAWGRAPTPIGLVERDGWFEEIDPYTPATVTYPIRANVQVTLLQLADVRNSMDDIATKAKRWLGLRDKYDQMSHTLALLDTAAELIWFLCSLSPDPEGLLEQLTFEALAKDVGDRPEDHGPEGES